MFRNIVSLYRFCFIFSSFILSASICYAGNKLIPPEDSMYCSVSNPLGITYDTKYSRKTLFIDSADNIISGESGKLAVVRPSKIDVYIYGKLVKTFQRNSASDISLIGWMNGNLIIQNNGKFQLLPIKKNSTKFMDPKLPPNTVTVVDLQESQMIFVQGDNGILVLKKNNNIIMGRLNIPGYLARNPIIVSKRDFVTIETMELKNNTVDSRNGVTIWAIDSKDFKAKKIRHYSKSISIAPVYDRISILVSEYNNSSAKLKSTNIVEIDLIANKNQIIVKDIQGQFDVLGFTSDNKYLVGIRVKAEVGPGTLETISLSDKAHTLLRDNVYDCFMVH